MLGILGFILFMVFIYVAVTLVFSFFKALGEFLEAIGNLFSSSDEEKPSQTYYTQSSPSSRDTGLWIFSPPKPESPYTRDWSSVSRKYKDSRSWRCERCYVNLSEKSHRRLLHVHHRDLNPKNNSSWNLIALCVICHSEEPGAGHKRLAGAISRDGRRRQVENLRW